MYPIPMPALGKVLMRRKKRNIGSSDRMTSDKFIKKRMVVKCHIVRQKIEV